MPNTIVNYDGSIKMTPQQVVRPKTVEEIQEVLRDTARFPKPVGAMGSCHSLTPCFATEGTIIDMKGMNRVIEIDEANKTLTAQAGLQFVEASDALRERDLQFMTNIEIGNLTLGSAATCHTKDALDGIEFGQVGTYITRIKWVTPAGDLAEASESSDPESLRRFRTSYGLAGVAYEVTFRVKPLEAIHLTYLPRPVDELTHSEVDDLLDNCEGLVCWTVGRTAVFQRRERIEEPRILASLFAAARKRLWNHTAAHSAHLIDQFISDDRLRTAAQDGTMDISELLYNTLHLFGGITLLHRIRPSITARLRSQHVMHFRSGHFRVASGSTHIAPISISRTSTSAPPDFAATCLSARTTSERIRRRCCRIPRGRDLFD